MSYCPFCGAQLVPNAKFCVKCGKQTPSAMPTHSEGKVESISEPVQKAAEANRHEIGTPANERLDAEQLESPREPDVPTDASAEPKFTLWHYPLVSDWIFWLVIAVLALGAVPGMFREARSDGPGVAGLVTAAISLVVSVGITWLIFGLLPAGIRSLVVRRKRSKQSRELPAGSSEPGWYPDPFGQSSERLWRGTSWSGAVRPGIKSSLNAADKWVMGLVLAALIVAVPIGFSAHNSWRESFASQSDSATNPNTATAIPLYLNDLQSSIKEFLSVKVDTSSPSTIDAAMKTAGDKFVDVQLNYSMLKGALANVDTQEELGAGAPSLDTLRKLVVVMEPYVSARTSFYTAFSLCESQPTAQADKCKLNLIDSSERRLMSTIAPVEQAFNAVIASIPKTSV